MDKPINLSENLEKLQSIASWFDNQEHMDVEEGLKKVQEAAVLIKESKSRLREIENEFEEIQSDLSDEIMEVPSDSVQNIASSNLVSTDGLSNDPIVS